MHPPQAKVKQHAYSHGSSTIRVVLCFDEFHPRPFKACIFCVFRFTVNWFPGCTPRLCSQVVYEDIMRWLFALHLRAPGCSVMLVANKCDGSIGDFAATAEAVEKRARELSKTWQEKRKIPDLTKVRLLRHPSLVSCDDGGGLSEVIDRVATQGATSAKVPPSWGLALTFLDALRDKRCPLSAARKYLGLGARSGEIHEDETPSVFMTKAALCERWNGLVESVEGELPSEADRMAVSDPESALEGALLMR